MPIIGEFFARGRLGCWFCCAIRRAGQGEAGWLQSVALVDNESNCFYSESSIFPRDGLTGPRFSDSATLNRPVAAAHGPAREPRLALLAARDTFNAYDMG